MRVWQFFSRARDEGGDFNSHTREGVTGCYRYITKYITISTHTPVRVWRVMIGGDMKTLWFQLTHPWGCDKKIIGRPILKKIFQLTHPWGCDADKVIFSLWSNDFNSHTREGVTAANAIDNIRTPNFNSHTREGVTLPAEMTNTLGVFQLTHPWGCDQKAVKNPRHRRKISTHTPVRVWPLSKGITNCFAIFQLTHPWGCDQHGRECNYDLIYFNSHTREGVTKIML